MRQFTPREFLKILRDNGYVFIRQNGSHAIYTKGSHSVTVPTRKLCMPLAERLLKECGIKTK